jgi:FtsZ-interacting cell division protein ZipA
MKRLILIAVITLAFFTLIFGAFAKNTTVNAQGLSRGKMAQAQEKMMAEPTEVVENPEIAEENTRESMPKAVAPRSESAKENMSEVAQKVEELLTMQTAQGGIGEQVRQITQEQKQAQGETETELGKVENRQGFLKFLFGPDYKALKSMKQQSEQNQVRIERLMQLQTQLVNQADSTQLQETIQALMDQNIALQERITLEEKSVSALGWLVRLFS